MLKNGVQEMKNTEWIFEVLYDIEKFSEVNGLTDVAKSLRALREEQGANFGEVEKFVEPPKLRLISRRSTS